MMNGYHDHEAGDDAEGRRQKPGAACIRCRTKKLKCDGQRPRCGTCIRANAECEPAAAQVQRGPKKGYLKMLQNKIATLEQQLAEAHGEMLPTSTALPAAAPAPERTSQLDLDFLPTGVSTPEVRDDMGFCYAPEQTSILPELSPNPLRTAWMGMGPTPPHSTDSSVATSLTVPLSSGSISTGAPLHMGCFCPEDSMNFGPLEALSLPQEPFFPPAILQSDLNQVYFERTHLSVPILHRRKYFSWAQSPSKTPAQICLQHAMWTSAASRSSHPQPLQDALYQATQRLLAAASNDTSSAATSIEYVQARILMSIHTFVHRSHRQGWISAGQCFRMVQLMRLHQLDDPQQPEGPEKGYGRDSDSWICLEEKRRAFWMAYCVDVLVSKRGQWPLTLHEHVRATRLPLSDDAFQSDEPYKTQYLHELFETPRHSDSGVPSPFLELIIFCTISRNIASLKRNRLDGRDSVVPTHDLFGHHSRLSGTLDLRTEALQASHPPSLLRSDPILLFTRMFAHALALCLCSCLKKTVPADTEGYQELIIAWQHRAFKAVFGIVDLAGSISSLSYFKMHPFTPLPLGICRDFLDSGQWVDYSTEPRVQELSHLLRDMSSYNNVAQDYLADCQLKET